MNEAIASGVSSAAFESFLASRLEPTWLTDLRRNAWKAFCELPMPHDLPAGPRLEEWRRTEVRRFHFEKFPLPNGEASSVAPAAAPLLTAGVDLAGHATALDSRPINSSLDPALAAKGVLFGSLDELVQRHGPQIEPFLFTRAVDPYYDKFSALHAACWSGGMILYVPKGVVIDRPLHMFSALSAGQSDFGHALIVLEEGAGPPFWPRPPATTRRPPGFTAARLKFLSAPAHGFGT